MRRPVPLVRACEDRGLIPLLPHASQREMLELVAANRITVGACGRRWGKTRLAMACALHNLFFSPACDELVAPGETRYAIVVSTAREQAAAVALQHALTLVQASRALSHELIDVTEHQLTFRRNRALLVLPCNARSLRGYPASFLCMDEAAHFLDTETESQRVADRVWAALAPSLSQFGEHGKALVISTPAGTSGFFSQLFHKAAGGEIPGANAFSAPTSANPLIDQTYLEAQRVVLGADDFDREHLATFTAGGGAFIDQDTLRACVTEWHEVLPDDARDWIVSFDPAFSRDPAALAVVGRSHDDPACLTVGYTQRWLPPKQRRIRRSREQDTSHIEEVIAEVAAVCSRYGVHRLIVDQHLAGTMESEFRKHGLQVVVRAWTSTTRTDAFRSLRALVATGRIELPNDPTLIAEAGRLRTKPGRSEIVLPRSGDSHCDLVVATAAAVLEHERHGPTQPARWASALTQQRGTSPPGRRGVRRTPPAPPSLARGGNGVYASGATDTATGLPAYTPAAIDALHRRLRGGHR